MNLCQIMALVSFAFVGLICAALYFAPPRGWRGEPPAPSPLTHDLCDICHKPLHLNERVEVMVGEPEFDGEFGGSFAMLATYCTDHAPEATA